MLCLSALRFRKKYNVERFKSTFHLSIYIKYLTIIRGQCECLIVASTRKNPLELRTDMKLKFFLPKSFLEAFQSNQNDKLEFGC